MLTFKYRCLCVYAYVIAPENANDRELQLKLLMLHNIPINIVDV